MSDAAEAQARLVRMDQRLRARMPEMDLWENYYEGVHRLAFATSRFRATFGNLFREFADNWCELIVNASVERLRIIGFRTEAEDTEPDRDAAQIWFDNSMKAESRVVQTEAVKLGIAYLLVDQENTVEDTESPLITVEHPLQAYTEMDPANRRSCIAGMKQWVDDYGRVLATVYMRDRIYRFETSEKAEQEAEGINVQGFSYPNDYLYVPSSHTGKKIEWIPRQGVPFEVQNTLGIVPLVPLMNNPTVKRPGRSDIAVVVPVQDAVNKLVADMIIASEFAAFHQRWATGIEVPKDAQTGRPSNKQSFIASAARVWASEHPDAKFGQFEASDLRNYVHAIEMLIQHVAALTRTPPHYLLGQSGAFPSGDSLAATETGLVAKVHSKQDDFGPSYVQTLNLALKAAKKPQKIREVMWKGAEQRVRAQRIDGALKMTTMGVPQDAIWEEIDATPEQIREWHTLKEKMGLDPYSTLWAKDEVLEAQIAEGKTPNQGPEGNLSSQQSAATTARVTRIND